MLKQLTNKVLFLGKNKTVLLCLLLFSVLSMVLVFTLTPIGSGDIWWHLKTGELISEQKSVPSEDTFSFSAYGNKWVTHEWLSELVLFQVYHFTGIDGLICFKAFLILLIIAVLYFIARLRTDSNFIIFPCLMIFLFISRHRFFIRPHLFSFLFFAVLLFLLETHSVKKQPDKKIYFVPLLFFVWVNMHGGVLFGLLLLAVYTLTSIKTDYKNNKPLFWVGVCSLLVCFLNPNGIDVFTYPMTIIKGGYVGTNREWLSPFDESLKDRYLVLYLKIFIAVIACSYFVKKSKWFLREIIYLFVFLLMAVKSQRNIPFLGIAMLPFVISNYSSRYYLLRRFIGRKREYFLKILIITVLSLLSVNYYLNGIPVAKENKGVVYTGFGVNKAVIPVDAVDFIKANNIVGNAFNTYLFGGYLIYRNMRVFIDGRADVYDRELYEDYRKSLVIPSVFQSLDQKYSFDLIFVRFDKSDINLHRYLYHSETWKLVYFDDIALIYLRDSKKYADLILKYSYHFINPVLSEDEFYLKDDVDRYISEYERALFRNNKVFSAYVYLAKAYIKKDDPRKAISVLTRGLTELGYNYVMLNQLGVIYKNLREYGRAEKCFLRAIEINPYLVGAYGNLAIIYSNKNRPDKAKYFYKKVLSIRPSNAFAKQQLEKME